MTDDERQKWLQATQQVLPFDFWKEEEEEAARQKAEAERRQQEQKESLPHFLTPKNDNEYLLECQWEYKHGDQDALIRMYKRSKTICLRFINAIGQKNRHVRSLTYDEKKLKAEDAATYIIEQYIKRPDFVITKNYPGYLFLRIAHEVYYRREVDKIVDFVDLQKFLREGYDDKEDDMAPGTDTEYLLGQRDSIHYSYNQEAESEEDREQKEAKAFYMWKQKQKSGGSK